MTGPYPRVRGGRDGCRPAVCQCGHFARGGVHTRRGRALHSPSLFLPPTGPLTDMTMISRLQQRTFSAARTLPSYVVVMGLVAGLLAGCGDKKDKASSQTAAKVNKEEITVHQINQLLAQQRGLAPAQAASASAQVLERLIDQELALQKAGSHRL